MNISWGIKITVLYVGFVILIITLVGKAMSQKVDLVSKDYYEQELSYQDKIDKKNRTHQLEEQLSWKVDGPLIRLKFPKAFKGKDIKGKIYFFRPSDERMDKTINFPSVDTSLVLNIAVNELKTGLYKMQIDWEVNNKEYYNEGVLNLN